MTTELFGVQVVGAPKPHPKPRAPPELGVDVVRAQETDAARRQLRKLKELNALGTLHIGAAPRVSDVEGFNDFMPGHGREREPAEEEPSMDEVARMVCDHAGSTRERGVDAFERRLATAATQAARSAQLEVLLEQLDAIFQNAVSETRAVAGLMQVLKGNGYLLGPEDMRTHLLYKAVEHTEMPTEGTLLNAMLSLPEELDATQSGGLVEWQDVVGPDGSHRFPTFQSDLRRYIESRVGSAFTRAPAHCMPERSPRKGQRGTPSRLS